MIHHKTPVAEVLGHSLAQVHMSDVSARAEEVATYDLLDAAGLCIAAKDAAYVTAVLRSVRDELGRCTAFGHVEPLTAGCAALVNGTAIHGEDFDDTLEGAPIRVGAMVIPAVLAAGEQYGCTGERALLGIICGLEVVCRLNQVVPGAIHAAGFHPVSVLGVFGAAAGVGVALGLDGGEMTNALGVAGSFASGTGEFLTAGAWTKRLHPGWAAQAGLRAALLGRSGFFGPATIFDGPRSVFRCFGPGAEPNVDAVCEDLGQEWLCERIALKFYACGTMIHPYIDCMLDLKREGVLSEDILDIVCETGGGLVPRLWEPLNSKWAPPSGYAGKFSMPYCMAVAFFEGDAGLGQFTDDKVQEPRYLELARKIRYVIDEDNEYPRNYTGHLRVTLKDGHTREYRRPHMRGGMREPMKEDEVVDKFYKNVSWGGWEGERSQRLKDFCLKIRQEADLSGLRSFGGVHCDA